MARVYVSTVVNARNDRVWARVRDFNGLPNWHPAIAESRIEGGEPGGRSDACAIFACATATASAKAARALRLRDVLHLLHSGVADGRGELRRDLR